MKNTTRPAEAAYILTVGVRAGANKQHDCRMALEALARAGFAAGETSIESMKLMIELDEKEND